MYQNIYENYIRLLYILLNVNSRAKNALIMNTSVRIHIIAKLNFWQDLIGLISKSQSSVNTNFRFSERVELVTPSPRFLLEMKRYLSALTIRISNSKIARTHFSFSFCWSPILLPHQDFSRFIHYNDHSRRV